MKISDFFRATTNGKLSTNRLMSLLTAMTALFIAVWLALHGIINTEYNILVGILISAAFGGKVVAGRFENKK